MSDLFTLLNERRAYYKAIEDKDGRLRSPLVVYSSSYASGGEEHHHVGRHYVNFSCVETDTMALRQFACALIEKLERFIDDGVVLLAIQSGGVQLATVMGQVLLGRGINVPVRIIEKIGITAPARPHNPGNTFMLRRHRIYKNERVILIEDVTNTHRAVGQAISSVIMASGVPIAVGCAVARSEAGVVQKGLRQEIPVEAALSISAPYHRQDEPFVAKALRENLVEFYPRDHWERLLSKQEEALQAISSM